MYLTTGFSRLEVPEQTLDGIPLDLELVLEINLLNFHAVSAIGHSLLSVVLMLPNVVSVYMQYTLNCRPLVLELLKKRMLRMMYMELNQ